MRVLESDLHGGFVAALRNDLVSEAHARLSENLYLSRVIHTRMVSPAAQLEALTEHLAILEAVRGRNSERAVAALDNHLKFVMHRVVSSR